MFRITITETKTVRKIFPKQWALVGDEAGRKMDYTPEVETIGESKSDIYMQEVESIELVKVIAAVNGVELEQP